MTEREIVKCKIYLDDEDPFLIYCRDGELEQIVFAPMWPGFIGFLYETGGVKSEIFPTTRAYLGADGVIRMYPQKKAEDEVLTPTHVLFRGQK